jgi:hypothetical protein
VIGNGLRTFLIAALLGAGPVPAAADAVPENAQTVLVRRYVEALKAERYADAYALLNAGERAYYKNARNLASVFTAGEWRILAYKLTGARGDDAHRVVFVREDVRYRDQRREVLAAASLTAGYEVLGNGAKARIGDPGKPWRAFASRAQADAQQLRVRVKKLSFFARRIEVVVSFANLGERYVTVMPYGRSILRDDVGNVYRLLGTRDWTLTDKQLFLGVRLAPSEQYTGQLSFATTGLDEGQRRFSLTLSPNVREHGDEPFLVEVGGIAASGA